MSARAWAVKHAPHPRRLGARAVLPSGVSYRCAQHGTLLQRELQCVGIHVRCVKCGGPAILRVRPDGH